MKRLTYLFLFIVLVFSLTGCHSTRKAIKTETEATLTAQTTEERNTEQTQQTAVLTNTEVKDLTNVVIDFTRIEFNDGSAATIRADPDSAIAQLTGRPREDRTKPPDGISAITTGRITINGNREEKTEATIKQDATAKTHEAVNTEVEQEEKQSQQTEEKPKYNFFDWLYLAVVGGAIIAALILGVRFVYTIYQYAKNR